MKTNSITKIYALFTKAERKVTRARALNIIELELMLLNLLRKVNNFHQYTRLIPIGFVDLTICFTLGSLFNVSLLILLQVKLL